MAQVTLEVLSWLSPRLGAQQAGRTSLQEEVAEGETVRDLLSRLASKYPDFINLVFDSQTGQLTHHVNLVLNSRLIELLQGLDTRLRDGDALLFLPAYSGG